jgi:toxin HigB-1
MIVEFGSGDLDRLETDPKYDGGRSAPVVRAYRKRMQEIRAAPVLRPEIDAVREAVW